jgi:transaldolase
MKFFLDSASIDEISYALDAFDIDGVTTNPKYIKLSGKPFLTAIRDIASLFEGTDKTISVEVNPRIMDPDKMVEEAEKLVSISPNFVIKIQSVEPAFKAVRVLTEKGIRVNCTLVFSCMQALHAMRAGAYYVSPFIGWKEANAEPITDFVKDLVTIRDNYGFDTQILVAATRNSRQIVKAAKAGADIVTANISIYKDGAHHPYTPEGIQKFIEHWDNTAYE